MDKQRNNWAAVFGKGQSVREELVLVDRSPEIEDRMRGYIVGVSDLFVMLHALDPDFVSLNGYIVLRAEDIQGYRVIDDNEFFLKRALQLKGIKPISQPEIDLSSFSALLSSANARFPLVCIQREIIDVADDEPCFIGRVQKLTDKAVILEEISPAAKWEGTRRYNFKDITRVDFGGGYEEALALVAEHDARR